MALTPHVYWAQRHDDIYLRVELTDAQNISVKVHENVLRFRAQGRGAKGQNEYEFSLEFLLPVKPEISYKSTQRQVNITLQKEQRGWWEKLTVHERKPVFLAPDFDRWLDESDAEMEIQEREEKLKAKHGPDNAFDNPKLGFLFSYNLVQFLGFSWIFINMTVRLFIFGQDFLYDTFHSISKVMFFCQILASVEVLNAAFGVVRTRVLPSLIQVVGRNFILFIIFGSLEEMQNKPVVFFVFYLWSSIEIIRYPFYLLSYCDIEWKTLTWLRYTVWIPLYPLGVLAEAVAVIQAIPMFDETKLFSIPLPKPIGTSVSFSYILYIYLVLMVLGLYINFCHLYKLRMRRIHTKKKAT
ncbi:very-long-chain (3R)-3-hydroxyacyl-CoA dehydratase [Sphaeramia orbicularis]|uniref:Very-long-chain (3R)-3-hydroxyacyl-CoA dehydratase n=1 Tax=Sphaeramia orbicularis TaxID=375764 RepID=A0A672Y4V6_9TELE|nr:very-long-chain (3R)-3-hydroxyacyl-CoA dehydratase-like [Sphaeramia orbicularis]